MEARGRTDRKSINDSNTDPLNCYPEDTDDFSTSENNSFEIHKEMERRENSRKNFIEELSECDCQDVNDSEVVEKIRKRCALCEGLNISKIIQNKLTLDAVLISPPKINRVPSQDEFSGTTLETRESNLMLNIKALPKEARTYELEKFQKNCLIIFNQESIDGFEPRLGTEQDVQALTDTFKNYGFEVIEHKDFTKEKIIEVLETFRETNFTDYGCVGVVVLTHGTFNGMLRAKDQMYNETEIIKYFRVYDKPTLITKPKLLIIQACRGTRCLPGVQAQTMGYLRKDLDEEVEPYTLPVMSDVLIVHSSYVGEASTRDELHGSWFIQTLCSKINEMSSTHDLESILTEVKREVAVDRHWEDYNRTTREMDIYKQMPTVTSTLIRKLYLRKFGDESPPVTYLDTMMPSTSTGPVLDTATTPLLYQFGPCSCFLDHFDYIKKCLTYFVEDHPNDGTARTFLEISNAFEDEDQFNAAKEKMAKAICVHLNHNAKNCDFYKYLYFYKH